MTMTKSTKRVIFDNNSIETIESTTLQLQSDWNSSKWYRRIGPEHHSNYLDRFVLNCKLFILCMIHNPKRSPNTPTLLRIAKAWWKANDMRKWYLVGCQHLNNIYDPYLNNIWVIHCTILKNAWIDRKIIK